MLTETEWETVEQNLEQLDEATLERFVVRIVHVLRNRISEWEKK